MNKDSKKYNFNSNASSALSAKTILTNDAENDNDDDFLDISDTELIRASQAIESQLKFTNNIHHTTSNALTIFSQFSNDGLAMAPPSTYGIGSTTVFSNAHSTDLCSQIEDQKSELKKVKNELMHKDGEVKILRDKLKRVEQELQRARTEKTELDKKLHTQQEDAKKILKKQMELKELEHQLKSQEVVELTMKCKQLESSVKKSNPMNKLNNITSTLAPISSNSSTIQIPSVTQINATTQSNYLDQSSSAFDEAFSLNKKNMAPPTANINLQNQQHMPQNPTLINNTCGRKRVAPMNTSTLSLSDGENENPVHENKRPALVQQPSKFSSNRKEQTASTPINVSNQNPTPITATETTPLATRPPLSPFCNNSHYITNVQSTKTAANTSTTPSTITNNKPTTPSLTKHASLTETTTSQFLNFNPTETIKKQPKYKRTCKLELKHSNFTDSFVQQHTISAEPTNKTNEKIYKFIDIFAVSESILREFNKSSIPEKSFSTNLINLNATSSCVQNLSDQLNNLLDFISYKSEKTTILNDIFTSATSTFKTTGSSSSTLSSNSSLLFIIERVEFVSNQLNEELIKLIKYCLNASLQDGLVVNKLSSIALISSESYKKIHSSLKITPASMVSIVDLLCLSFEVCYSLFLFRIKFLHCQNELNRKKLNKLIKPQQNNKTQADCQFIYLTLIRLKQEFFKLIVLLLKSINFSASIPVQLTTASKPNKETTNLSNSSTSYSTLKILNSIMDCFNHLIYFPILNKKLEPHSLLTVFYFSLINNMHNINEKKLLKYSQLFDKIEDDLDKPEEKMQEDDDNNDLSNEFEDNEEPCLFKLFYEKIIKYFGEIVYSLEDTDNKELTGDENSSIIFNNVSNKQLDSGNNDDQQISIITTIAADDETSHANNNFSTEKQLPISRLASSKSQSDFLESIQSQASLEEDSKQNFDFSNSNVNLNSCSLQYSNGSILNRCIHLLQTQLLSNFINFLHNYQLFSSSFIQTNVCENKKNRDYFEYHEQCLCYKDLLLSFLILFDYQFNEKFICGAKLCIDNCFKSFASSNCLISPRPKNLNEDSNATNLLEEKNLTKSKMRGSVCDINEKTNRLTFLLIMRCCNSLVNLFDKEGSVQEKIKEDNRQFEGQKIRFYRSIKDDYRLKNLYCLYSLAEKSYENYILKNFSQTTIEETPKASSSSNMFKSLNSIRPLFKTYMDEYFDLD